MISRAPTRADTFSPASATGTESSSASPGTLAMIIPRSLRCSRRTCESMLGGGLESATTPGSEILPTAIEAVRALERIARDGVQRIAGLALLDGDVWHH